MIVVYWRIFLINLLCFFQEKVAKTEVVTKKDEKKLAQERKKEAADQVIRDKEFEKAAENDGLCKIIFISKSLSVCVCVCVQDTDFILNCSETIT